MRRRRVTLTGASGQLGRAIIVEYSGRWVFDTIERPDADIRDWPAVRDRVAAFQPDLVVHAAAATDVDGCEREPELAFEVNALGTRNVARAAAAVGAEMVAISTNYVFDGAKVGAYHEFDPTNPISVYGASKLAGEQEARAATTRCHVLRTAWLYAEEGRNFPGTMRRLMATRDRIGVVDDQYGNPTYATDVARVMVEIIERLPYGVHHVVNDGSASWWDWATEIARLDGSATTIDRIPASMYQRAAAPPSNGTLISVGLARAGISLPDWRDALRRCLVR